MKATGIVRNIDDLGRCVIPKELRRTLDMQEGTSVEFYVEGDTIIIKKYQPGCVFCGEVADTTEFKGKLICLECATEIGK